MHLSLSAFTFELILTLTLTLVCFPRVTGNTGTAFALSSGTLGAALAASLAGVRSIAVSYGHFVANPPTLADRGDAKGPGLEPGRLREVAHMANQLSVRIIQRLWAGWANESEVGCYSINLPLSETLTQPEIFWTRIWENRYGPVRLNYQSFRSSRSN